jgi:hypothetical protein
VSYDPAFWKGDPCVEARLAYQRLADGQELEGVDRTEEEPRAPSKKWECSTVIGDGTGRSLHLFAVPTPGDY